MDLSRHFGIYFSVSPYGWDRTRIDGTAGAQIWTGQGVFAHNLVKIGALAS